MSAAYQDAKRGVVVKDGRYWYVLGDRRLPGPDIEDKGLDDSLIVILGEDESVILDKEE